MWELLNHPTPITCSAPTRLQSSLVMGNETSVPTPVAEPNTEHELTNIESSYVVARAACFPAKTSQATNALSATRQLTSVTGCPRTHPHSGGSETAMSSSSRRGRAQPPCPHSVRSATQPFLSAVYQLG